MTVLQLIKASLRAIGQLGPGRTPGVSETADAVFALNRLLAAWSAERMNVYAILRSEHTLVASQQSYTIGLDETADFNVARPVRIEDAGILGSSETPVKVLTPVKWAAITQKSQQSTKPGAVYYESTSPLGTLYVWPVPTSTPQLVLYTWQQLTAVADETVTLTFPPAYEEALTYNLALRLAPEWGRVLRPDVIELAHESLARIKSLNAPTVEMQCDGALVSRTRFDILTGDYR